MMRSRLLLGAVVAAAFIGILAALPAPRLSVSRAPDVIPKHTPPGDVRNISLASDPPYVQAALEVFDGTDWEIYYWTDSAEITPQASAVTADIVEQRWARLAIGGGQVMIAWIEDTDVGSNIRATSKRDRGYRYSWRPSRTVLTETTKLGGLALALTPDGKPVIAYVKERRVWITWPPGSSTVVRLTDGEEGSAERNPSIAIGPDGRIAVAVERPPGISLFERTASGWTARRLVSGGRRPQVAAEPGGWRVGYTEGGGARARVVVASAPSGVVRRHNIRLGAGAPVAITFEPASDLPVVSYIALEGERQFAWLVRPGASPRRIPVPTSKKSPSPSPSPS